MRRVDSRTTLGLGPISASDYYDPPQGFKLYFVGCNRIFCRIKAFSTLEINTVNLRRGNMESYISSGSPTMISDSLSHLHSFRAYIIQSLQFCELYIQYTPL